MRARSHFTVMLLSFLMAVALVTGALALPSPTGGKGISAMTLHVQRITTLEDALRTAVISRDLTSLNKLLSPFFEVRRAGIIVEREAWLREGDKSDGELHQLSAYEVGNSVVANFILMNAGQPNRFVVDVWTLEQDEWQLRVRFETSQAQNLSKLPHTSMPNNK